MDLIRVNNENIEAEHICCAISNNDDVQVKSKKSWLKEMFDNGLVFLKCDVRGKCFIEYLPAEYAWVPVDADGYMFINCLWVSGKYKGMGYSNLLLEECIRDSKEKGKKGLVILSSAKKMGFLSDPKFMKYKGFESVDSAQPYFELLYLPFDKAAEKPKFNESLKETNKKEMPSGFVMYYTNQCPFTAKYVPILKEYAKNRGVDIEVVHIESKEQADKAPIPFTTFSLFYNGELVSHEILSEKKLEKILESKGY